MSRLISFFFAVFLLLQSIPVFAQTDDWKQYSSSTAGFKVKHPSDWTAREEWKWPVAHIVFVSPGVFDRDVMMTAGIGICSQPKGHVSTSSKSNSRCRERDDHLSDHAKN